MKLEIYNMESKKYVDFDKVITTYKTFGHLNLHNALEAFNEIPAADVRPVRRGKWTLNKDGSGTCSECGRTQKNCWDLDNWDNFCHFCGADMREIINE